jgi:uncharacterized damage-inducible protein DinB
MRAGKAWFDRTFDVPYPVDLLPPLYARLRGTPARLEETVREVSRERLTAKLDGTWSAQENAGHLLDLESLWLARVEDYVALRAELTPADLTGRPTDAAGHNAEPLARILADFRRARARLLDRAAALDAPHFAAAIPHPRMRTPMRLADHLYFVAEHDDHHLARIWELVSARR